MQQNRNRGRKLKHVSWPSQVIENHKVDMATVHRFRVFVVVFLQILPAAKGVVKIHRDEQIE